ALDLVGFLAVLGGRAGGEEDRALARHPLAQVDVERRDRRASLDPGERAGTASVEDQEAEGRRRAAHQLLQLGQLERGLSQVQRPTCATEAAGTSAIVRAVSA